MLDKIKNTFESNRQLKSSLLLPVFHFLKILNSVKVRSIKDIALAAKNGNIINEMKKLLPYISIEHLQKYRKILVLG